MLFVIDIGNTNMVIGLYDGEDLVAHWRVATVPTRTADELAVLMSDLFRLQNLSIDTVTGFIVSCVVPPLQPAIVEMAERYFQQTPVIVGPGMKTGMRIHYDNPREVGADRIVNSVGAYALYPGELTVVDFGTATTFDSIDAEGDYLGGVIAPGINISAEALFRSASKLSRVEIVRPPKVVGSNTVHSMQSGLVYGYAGLVDAIVRRIGGERDASPTVVATGGLATVIGPETETIDHVIPDLTLVGLRILYERNRAA